MERREKEIYFELSHVISFHRKMYLLKNRHNVCVLFIINPGYALMEVSSNYCSMHGRTLMA